MGRPRALFHLFSSFQANYTFLQQTNVKNVKSIQYAAQGFEHTSRLPRFGSRPAYASLAWYPLGKIKVVPKLIRTRALALGNGC